MIKGNGYCITSQNLAAHELIGLNAAVIRSTDKARVGTKGKVVDETKNTFVIEGKDGKEKVIPKNEASIRFSIGKEKVVLNKDLLNARPEDRIKIFMKKRNA